MEGVLKLRIPARLLAEIASHLEAGYPEEVAGLLLGSIEGEERRVVSVLPVENRFEADQRGRRYQIDPKSILQAEEQADRLGLSLVGVFHSHPDHPPTPSRFDLDWAVPWYDYLITEVRQGAAGDSRAWRLQADHRQMTEVTLAIEQEAK